MHKKYTKKKLAVYLREDMKIFCINTAGTILNMHIQNLRIKEWIPWNFSIIANALCINELIS